MHNLKFKFCLFTLVAGPSVCLLGRLNGAPDFICFISSQKSHKKVIKIAQKIDPQNLGCPKIKQAKKLSKKKMNFHLVSHMRSINKISKELLQKIVQKSIQKASKTLKKIAQKLPPKSLQKRQRA